MIAAALIAGALVSAPMQVHTATRDVRDCLALGGDGYVAATDGGVVFVDRQGSASAPLTILDGLPQTRSFTVEAVAGSTSQVLVGTEGGLARIEQTTKGLRVVEAVATDAPVRAVLERGDRIVLGTWGDGVLELRGGKLTALASPDLAKADRITDLAVHGGQIVAASAGAGAWTLGAAPQPIAGFDGVVWSLAVHGGSLYAGTFVGVLASAPEGMARTVSSHDARALASVDGELWIASRDRGLDVLGSDAARPDLHGASVQGLDADRCLATTDGMWIRDGEAWRPSLDAGLPSGDITDLLRVGDRLYAATFDRGVAVLIDGRWTSLEAVEGLAPGSIDPQVNALAAAQNGDVFVATARGLYRVGEGSVRSWTTKQGLPNTNFQSLARTRAGELVVGTHAGVAILDAAGDLRELGSRARRWSTWAIAETPDGDLWLGTTQGLIRWQSDGRWQHLSMLSGHLSDNWVTALTTAGDALYVGTYASGVDRLTPSGDDWTHDALGGGRINPGGLRVVDGRLHASTMKGVIVHERDRWRDGPRALFEDATDVLEDAGGVWVASRRGLVWRDS